MLKVAITGGLSSGKSSVCKLLRNHGAYYVSADDIVHQLLSPNSPIGHKIISLLGEDIVNNNQFDRQKIAKKVFGDKEALKSLERLIHPAVLEEIEKQYEQVKNQPQYTLFVAEIPLLFETESERQFDKVVTVHADPKISQKRFEEKTKHPIEEFEKRMSHQLPLDHKCAKADFIISNQGDMADLHRQVDNLYKYLTH